MPGPMGRRRGGPPGVSVEKAKDFKGTANCNEKCAGCGAFSYECGICLKYTGK